MRTMLRAMLRVSGRIGGGIAAIGVAASLIVLLLSGCGMRGAPQPPSLKLPEPVSDLTAVRNGNSVTLRWTMPRRTTDRLQIASQSKGPVQVHICLRTVASGDCQSAGDVSFAPGVAGEFIETLPAPLSTGAPRQLDYFVELRSPKGRTAGLSNPAPVTAGAAPGEIRGLAAEVRANGVALRWEGTPPADAVASEVRLHRKLLSPVVRKKKSGPMQPSAEPVERDLLAEETDQHGALDESARFGETYQYTAQRVQRPAVEDKTLELDGAISEPVRVDVVDTFPPAVPRDLAAVYAADEKTIDLSWVPDTDEDLAGYFVYRTQSEPEDNPLNWKRISGSQPLAASAFRDPAVEPGHSYRYAVTAIDLTGHESKRSAEATESMPNP